LRQLPEIVEKLNIFTNIEIVNRKQVQFVQ